MKNTGSHPPGWARKLLRFSLRPDYSDEILGDLTEAYHWRSQEEGPNKAKLKFVIEALGSLRPSNLKSINKITVNTMILRNYVTIAWRSMRKRRATSLINTLGLAIGAAAFMIIFLHVNQILTFDEAHINRERTFMAYKERITPDGIQAAYDTWVPMKDRLLSDYPQVEEAARVYESEAKIVKNNQYLDEDIIYADEAFFDIFSYPLRYGNENKVFTKKHSIVLSLDLALKYFDKENPIGEYMEVFLPDEDTTLTFQVSAVVDQFPENVAFQPHLVIQLESIPVYPEIINNWGSSFLETYVLLDKKEGAQILESSFPDLVENIWGAETRENTNFKLLPFTAHYDTFVGSKADARMLLWIGIGILLIAAINFMNLSTAQASQRMKEIGVRKVLGAFRRQVGVQFYVEAFLTASVAIILGLFAVYFALPYFNEFFDIGISLESFTIAEIVVFSLGLAFGLGVLSGTYPSIYLSSLRSVDALQRKAGFGGSVGFRNVLVVFQFSIALFLIAGTIIIRDQIRYMLDSNMGFDSENTLLIRASAGDFIDREQGIVRLNTFKEELRQKSYIGEVAMSRAIPTTWTRSFTFVRPDGWNGDPLRMRYTYVDSNFFNTYGIEVKYGTSFLSDAEGDQRESVILNEAAMRAFEFDPEQQNVIKIGDRRINVVGIVEDFNFESLEVAVAPTLIFHRTAKHPVHRFITAHIGMADIQNRLQEIEGMWRELGSTENFTFYFLDDEVQDMYSSESRYLGLISLFSATAIAVACLGLYGLTLFVIEKRRKEISIRKVLGAETSKILSLIFRDFTKWVLLSFVLSVPFVVFILAEWLNGYHYHIDITWITFLQTLAVVLGLVLLTVGYQSLKAATSDPVDYLQDE